MTEIPGAADRLFSRQFNVGYNFKQDGEEYTGTISCEIPTGGEKAEGNEPISEADEGDVVYRVKIRVKESEANSKGSECRDQKA